MSEFKQGVAWAAARLVELFDQPSMAEEILSESGVTAEDIKYIDEHDLSFIKGIIPAPLKGE